MNDENSDCMNQLECIRESWLNHHYSKPTDSSEYVVNSTVEVSGSIYRHDIYEGRSGDRMLVVFELSIDRVIGSTHYCLGIEYFNDKQPLLVTMEELWDEGIP